MKRDEAIEWLKNLPADEPVFAFRAHDSFAPAAVQVWAALCLASDNKKTRIKGDRASNLVIEMQEWQKKHGSKVPD